MNAILKKTHFLIITGFLIGCAAKEAAVPAAPAPEAAPAAVTVPIEVRLGRLIGINHTTFTLKNEADAARYEKVVAEVNNPAWVRHVPGALILTLKGDRGVNDGKYTGMWNFDTIDRRNHYFPEPDAEEYPVFTAAVEPLNAEIERVNPDTFEFVIDTPRVYTDYVLVGSDQIAELPLVGLLGVHNLKVKAGLEEAFEAFMAEKWYPAALGGIPGNWSFIYKGDRGANIGGYISVSAFDSPERRDAYWPEPGVSSEAWTAATEAAPLPEGLLDELNAYFEPPDTTAAGEPVDVYTDWVIIR